MATITIHGDKFTGNARDWKDAKTEIVTAIANAGCTFVVDAGTTLFQLAGSGDHSDVGDDEIAKYFEEKEWPTQLLSIRSQITKTTLDTKCEEYQALSDQRKTKLRNWKIVEWFRQANTRVVKALRDHLLPKKAEKGGPKTAQLRQLFMTAQMTAIVDGEHTEINLETAEYIWTMPVVKLWADILALLEGKGRSGSSSFWSLMCNAVKSVNPKIKGHPGDFAIARNDLDNAWQSLRKMHEKEDDPVEALIDRLQAEQHLEMMRLLTAHPQEGP
jgi:hypothetical protein